MNTFDNIIFNNLQESLVNISRDELDSTVFQFKEDGTPILRDSIKIQILKDIDEIRNIMPVVAFYIVGDILTKNYTEKTDIDIPVQVDKQLIDSISTADIMHLLKYLNGRLAADTQHAINYYIITYDFDSSKSSAVYDIVNEKWIKPPITFEPEIEKWVSKLYNTLTSIDISTGEIQHDLLDFDEISNLNTDIIKRLRYVLRQKLMQIDELLKQLIQLKSDTKSLKKFDISQYTTPNELHLFCAINKLPENITYKLFEKYYYTKAIQKLESIIDERGELELNDKPLIRKIMGNVWKS
ncbi:MAG: hypothetical protein PHS54_00655 [Clostridia bacterium]|nr:hypothetical protein [Clostridia bacterium]